MSLNLIAKKSIKLSIAAAADGVAVICVAFQ